MKKTVLLLISFFFTFISQQLVANGINFSITITPMKNIFLCGEPVRIELNRTNLSSDILYLSKFEFSSEVYLSKDKVSFEPLQLSNPYIIPFIMPPEGAKTTVDLLPGESWKTTRILLAKYIKKKTPPAEMEYIMEYIFFKPGRYYLKVKEIHGVKIGESKYEIGGIERKENKYRNIEIESNIATIEIKEPQGNDSLVWEKIKSPEFAEFLQLGYVLEKAKESEVIKTLKQIIETYPASTYTPYIKEALIKYYRTKPDKTPEEKEYLKTLQKD